MRSLPSLKRQCAVRFTRFLIVRKGLVSASGEETRTRRALLDSADAAGLRRRVVLV